MVLRALSDSSTDPTASLKPCGKKSIVFAGLLVHMKGLVALFSSSIVALAVYGLRSCPLNRLSSCIVVPPRNSKVQLNPAIVVQCLFRLCALKEASHHVSSAQGEADLLTKQRDSFLSLI